MNTAGPIRTAPARRRKASIEIYFVLYLSAIILLLGTTPSRNHNEEGELEQAILHLLAPDFRVRVERSALLYSFIPAGITLDTTGANLRRDSMNLVTARGRFSSVRFTIVSIEDSGSGQTLPPEAHATLTRRDDRTSIFQWRPSPSDRNAVYRVTVVGTATPLPPSDLKPELQDRISEVLKRHGTVSDSVTFTVNVFALRDQAMVSRMALLQTPTLGSDDPGIPDDSTNPLITAFPSLPSSIFGQQFEMQPLSLRVAAVQGRLWRNRVSLGGNASFADLDLRTDPPGINIVSQTPTLVELSGQAPLNGERLVTLTATRRSDGRTGSITFAVRSATLPSPDIAQSMFVGQSYRLDFSVPDIPSENMAVEVIENDKIIISRNERRSVIVYQPSGTGRVDFVRYMDDQRIDAIDAEIRTLPLPSMQQQRAQSNDTEVIMTTTCYGMVGGMPNRCRLVVQDGNVLDPEQMDQRYDEKNKMMTQTWRLRRRDTGQEFTFTAYALDQRGSGSGKSKPVQVSMNNFR